MIEMCLDQALDIVRKARKILIINGDWEWGDVKLNLATKYLGINSSS